jgi:hypothetical protein
MKYSRLCGNFIGQAGQAENSKRSVNSYPFDSAPFESLRAFGRAFGSKQLSVRSKATIKRPKVLKV